MPPYAGPYRGVRRRTVSPITAVVTATSQVFVMPDRVGPGIGDRGRAPRGLYLAPSGTVDAASGSGEFAYLGVARSDCRDRLGIEYLGPDRGPLRRLGRTGQGPGRLTCGAIRHVLAEGGHDDRAAEHRGRNPADGLRAGTAADEEYPLDVDALGDQGIQPVGEAAQHTLDSGARDVCRRGGGQP
jgi:hypothetical protein